MADVAQIKMLYFFWCSDESDCSSFADGGKLKHFPPEFMWKSYYQNIGIALRSPCEHDRRHDPSVDFAQSETGELHDKVCDGCPTNCTCTFKEPGLAPQCISLVDAGIEHAYSNGGLSTVEDLFIFKGYWRSTNTSTIVRKCYNPIACPGGLTTGNCSSGYKGPCECSMKRAIDDLYPLRVLF